MSAVVAVAGPADGNVHAWERGRLVRDGDGRHLDAAAQGHGRLQELEGPRRGQSAWEETGEDMASGDHEVQKGAVEEEEAVWKRASVAEKAAAVPTTTTKT